MLKERDEIVPIKCKLIAQYHPAAALHNPRLWATLLEDWEHLPEHVSADFQVLKEKDLPTSTTPPMSLDTETDQAGSVGTWSVAFRNESGTLCVVPFNGDRHLTFPGTIVMHNAKYDLRELRKTHIKVSPNMVHDTMIMAYSLGLGKQGVKDSSKNDDGGKMTGGLGLKYLARRQLGMTMLTYNDVKDCPELIPEYNARDSVATYLLFEKWIDQMPEFYYRIDRPLLDVCMSMEDRGMLIDVDYLTEFAGELDKRLKEFDLPLNPNAPQQVQSYVYGALGVEPWKFTDSGAPSVDDDVLEVLHDPLIDKILEYKAIFKEKGTYVDNYVRAMDEEHRIHPEFKQTSTSTARLSCARPNLQNVFKRDDRVRVRQLFIAPEGQSIVRMDYNQLDYRALAALTKDDVLIQALAANKKIHQVTADELGISYDDAKTTNFALLFGAEAWTISQSLHITIEQAKDFMKHYFERFPGIKRFRDMMTAQLKETKRVVGYYGRERRIDAMFVENWRVQQEGLKEGVNWPVQNLEAEVVKLGMNDLHYRHAAPMVCQIHDELLFEVPTTQAQEFGHWLLEYVPTIVGEINGVSFPVEVGIGKNWYEAMQKENAIK